MATARDAATLVQLNVGGVAFTTTLATLKRDPHSRLGRFFSGEAAKRGSSDAAAAAAVAEPFLKVSADEQSYFVDRDGRLFRFVLDYLRSGELMLPERFDESQRLKEEARFYQLKEFGQLLNKRFPEKPFQLHKHRVASAPNGLDELGRSLGGGHITLGYRGTFAFGRDGQADVKFRKLNRILVCGKASLCREVFGESLNESRDPDREGAERYTSRLYLKHQSIEKAFDLLAEKSFGLVASCASGANGMAPGTSYGSGGLPMVPTGSSSNAGDIHSHPRSSADWEEQRWAHYNQFIFARKADDDAVDPPAYP